MTRPSRVIQTVAVLLIPATLSGCWWLEDLFPQSPGANVEFEGSREEQLDEARRSALAGEFERATVLYNRVLEEEPANIRAQAGVVLADEVGMYMGRVRHHHTTSMASMDHLIQKDPEAIEAWEAKVFLSRHTGVTPNKVATSRALRKKFPQSPVAYFFLAEKYIDRGNDPPALPLLEKALHTSPPLLLAHRWLGVMYAREGRYAEAAHSNDAYMALGVTNVLRDEATVILKHKAGQYSAEDLGTHLPNAYDRAMGWAWFYQQYERPFQSPLLCEAYERAIAARPADPQPRWNYADQLLKPHTWNPQRVTEILEPLRNTPEALSLGNKRYLTRKLAYAYEVLGLHDKKAEVLAWYLGFDPENTDYRIKYGHALKDAKRFRKAAQVFALLRKTNIAGEVGMYTTLIHLGVEERDPERVDAQIDKLLSLKNARRFYFAPLADYLSEHGYAKQADRVRRWRGVHDILKYRKKYGKEPESFTRGIDLAKAEKFQDAIPPLEKTLAAGYTPYEVYWNLGKSYKETGQCEKAIPHLRNTIKAKRGATGAMIALMECAQEAGDDEEAFRQAMAALRVDADNRILQNHALTAARRVDALAEVAAFLRTDASGNNWVESDTQRCARLEGLVMVLEEMGDHEEAWTHIDAALRVAEPIAPGAPHNQFGEKKNRYLRLLTTGARVARVMGKAHQAEVWERQKEDYIARMPESLRDMVDVEWTSY